MKIGAGEFSKSVILKEPTTTKNTEGGRELSYLTNSIVTWAKVEDATRSRRNESPGTALVGSKRFYLRKQTRFDDLTKDWLLVYKNKSYTIDSLEDVEEDDNRYLLITARVKTNA